MFRHARSSLLIRLSLVMLMALVIAGCDRGPSAPTGKWVASNPDNAEETVTIDFVSDSKLKFVMSAGPMKMEFDCDYTYTADAVNIKSPMPDDPEDLVLTRKGNEMSGSFAGDGLTFKKQ